MDSNIALCQKTKLGKINDHITQEDWSGGPLNTILMVQKRLRHFEKQNNCWMHAMAFVIRFMTVYFSYGHQRAGLGLLPLPNLFDLNIKEKNWILWFGATNYFDFLAPFLKTENLDLWVPHSSFANRKPFIWDTRTCHHLAVIALGSQNERFPAALSWMKITMTWWKEPTAFKVSTFSLTIEKIALSSKVSFPGISFLKSSNDNDSFLLLVVVLFVWGTSFGCCCEEVCRETIKLFT